MAAKTVNLLIEQGTTFSRDLVFTDSNGIPVDLTNHTISAHLARRYGDGFAPANGSKVAFSTATIDAPNGVLNIGLSVVDTLALIPGRYVYEVQVADAAAVTTRIFQGIVTVTPKI